MNTTRVKTAELTGAALDWAVAIAIGGTPDRPQDGQFIDSNGARWLAGFHIHAPSASYYPSTNWTQCGPLRDKYRIDIMDFSVRDEPLVSASYEDNSGLHTLDADTALIAICRAVVAGKLGGYVEVPAELLGGVG